MRKETVVITGASAGLGRAIAHEFATHGARIGLIARDRDRLEEARREVERRGGRALVLPLDVADENAVFAAAATVEKELSPIDIWVNNAMVSVFSPARQMRPNEYRRVTDVTYLGYVWGTLAALTYMVPRNRGAIVQVGSALAVRSIPLQSAYCAAKHAMVGFTDSLRSELLHDRSRVRLTVVQMPALNTPQFNWVRSRLPRKPQPVPPIFQPEVGARAVAWAAHHRRRELYVGASSIKAIWGQKLAAGYADRYLARHGFDAQQYDGAADPNRPDNLDGPVPGDFGAHGDFDARAHRFSPQLWLSLNRNWLLYAGAAVVAGLLTAGSFSAKEQKRPSRAA
jgi:NADP-dependent 3-hydroxy acid dehydrogenase YdfG